MDNKLEELKRWAQELLEKSRRDMSGTNEYHLGYENALEAMLEKLEQM